MSVFVPAVPVILQRRGVFGPGGFAPVDSIDWTSSTSIPAWATFTATGLATQFDSTGKLTYRPNNLVLNSATLSTQTVAVKAGVNYVLSIKGTGSVTLTGASTAGPLNGTGASNRVDLKITAATTSLTLTVSGSVTSARLSAVTYETAFRLCDDVDNTAAAYYGPRFDYTYNGSSWVPAGLLVEGAATNQHKYSGALATTLTASNITTVANAGTAPDGGNNLTKLIEVASTATHFVYDTTLAGGIASATTTTISYFVKAGTRSFVGLNLQGAANNYASVVFNLSNGTVSQTSTGGTSGTINASGIESKGSGVYRIWMAATVTGSSTPCLFLTNAATGNVFTSVGLVSYTATGEDFFVWGGQVETGSFASSYTPTGASAVTRAAESLVYSGYASNPFAIFSAPESTGSFACNKYADQATANAAIAAANQWIKSVKIWPVGTPSGSQTC